MRLLSLVTSVVVPGVVLGLIGFYTQKYFGLTINKDYTISSNISQYPSLVCIRIEKYYFMKRLNWSRLEMKHSNETISAILQSIFCSKNNL